MPGRRWRDPRELNPLGETAPEAGGTAARRGATPRLALLEKFARGARPTAAGADATDDMARGRFKNARYDHQRLSAVEGTVRARVSGGATGGVAVEDLPTSSAARGCGRGGGRAIEAGPLPQLKKLYIGINGAVDEMMEW